VNNSLTAPQQVRDLVSPIVDAHQPDAYRLVLLEPWYSDGMHSWMVPIDVDRDGVSATEFSRVLAEIEQDIVDKTGHDLVVHATFVTEHPQTN